MGIKDFFRKVGRGIKKGAQAVGRFFKNKVLPTVGRIAKPILGVLGVLPGKLGMIGKVGGGIADVIHGVTDVIPNKDIRDKVNDAVARGNEKFQDAISRGQDTAQRINEGIDKGRQAIDDVKRIIGKPRIVDPAAKVDWKNKMYPK